MKNHARSVVTTEDPVEYQMDGISQLRVDHHRSLGFSQALKGVLRLNPDYVLVGEVRDTATAQAAVDASAAGRVLMTTLHSPDAVGDGTRLRNLGVSDEAMCSSVRMIDLGEYLRSVRTRRRKQEMLLRSILQPDARPIKIRASRLSQMALKFRIKCIP